MEQFTNNYVDYKKTRQFNVQEIEERQLDAEVTAVNNQSFQINSEDTVRDTMTPSNPSARSKKQRKSRQERKMSSSNYSSSKADPNKSMMALIVKDREKDEDLALLQSLQMTSSKSTRTYSGTY